MYSDFSPRLIGFHVCAAVIGAESARGRDGDVDPAGVARIENDRVQAHSAGAGLPVGSRAVAAQSGEFLPDLAAVGRAENRGVFHAGVDRVRIGERRFEVPDALELPGMLRAVIPLMSGKRLPVSAECRKRICCSRRRHAPAGDLFASRRLPRLAAVVRALDHLPEPAAGLRSIEPVRIGRRSLQVVDLPARKVGAADLPLFALAVRGQNERALARADEHPYAAHVSLPSERRGIPTAILI